MSVPTVDLATATPEEIAKAFDRLKETSYRMNKALAPHIQRQTWEQFYGPTLIRKWEGE